jgi:5-methylcytosine-specific restriction protein A
MGNESRRTRPLPPGWKAIRQRILSRDRGLCQWPMPGGTICAALATDVDHWSGPEDDSDANLVSLCHPHHAAKTNKAAGRLGGLAAGAQRREIAAKKYRQPERHPGYRRGPE